MSSCPEIKYSKSEMKTQTKVLCYNCGSHDHTLKNCTKERRGPLEFAVCFICKAKGHISRDCPQNEKGMYAKGGGCFICGDSHH